MGFRAWGLGFGVQGLRFGPWGFGFGVRGLGFGWSCGSTCWRLDLGCLRSRFKGFRFRVLGLGILEYSENLKLSPLGPALQEGHFIPGVVLYVKV